MTAKPGALLVFDADVLIASHHHYDAPDFCPAFWDCLLRLFHNGSLLSIDRVYDEIVSPDGLVKWVKDAPDGLFVPSSDPLVTDAYRNVAAWVSRDSRFTPDAKTEFANGADGWLIACAQVHKAVVVTNEVLDLNIRKRVPIPNVCRQFNLPYVNTFEMLRQLGLRFVLDPAT